MKLRLLTTLSLVANVALVALVLRSGRGPESGAGGAERARSGAVQEASRLRTNLTRIEVTLTNEALPFHWRDVASEDFKQYVAGLRSIGCPPETVRDIIQAELTTLFLARRRAIVEPFQREYWTVAARGEKLEHATKPYEEAIKKLEKETVEKLDEYVGSTSSSKDDKRRQFDPETAFIPDEKRKAVERLNEQFDADSAKLRADLGAKDKPQLRAQLDALEKQRRESIAALLSPEEHAEFQLRRSRHAREAQASTGFEGTPEEARAIARAYEQLPEPPSHFDRKDPGYAPKKAAADQATRQREEAVKAALGPECYAQFKQGFDGNFREVFRITERYGLSRDAAAQAAEVLRARNAALDQLRSFGAMGDERELAAHQVARAALLQALGERALRTYERYHGPIVPVEEPASARE
jgi:hypothetical protein